MTLMTQPNHALVFGLIVVLGLAVVDHFQVQIGTFLEVDEVLEAAWDPSA